MVEFYVESSTDIAGQISISALSFRIRFVCVSYLKIESKMIDVSLQKLWWQLDLVFRLIMPSSFMSRKEIQAANSEACSIHGSSIQKFAIIKFDKRRKCNLRAGRFFFAALSRVRDSFWWTTRLFLRERRRVRTMISISSDGSNIFCKPYILSNDKLTFKELTWWDCKWTLFEA